MQMYSASSLRGIPWVSLLGNDDYYGGHPDAQVGYSTQKVTPLHVKWLTGFGGPTASRLWWHGDEEQGGSGRLFMPAPYYSRSFPLPANGELQLVVLDTVPLDQTNFHRAVSDTQTEEKGARPDGWLVWVTAAAREYGSRVREAIPWQGPEEREGTGGRRQADQGGRPAAVAERDPPKQPGLGGAGGGPLPRVHCGHARLPWPPSPAGEVLYPQEIPHPQMVVCTYRRGRMVKVNQSHMPTQCQSVPGTGNTIRGVL